MPAYFFFFFFFFHATYAILFYHAFAMPPLRRAVETRMRPARLERAPQHRFTMPLRYYIAMLRDAS